MSPRRSPRAALGLAALAVPLLAIPGVACASGAESSRVVTATAYNSLPRQTNDQPSVAAWGDSLEPGMKVIAVSRDLIEVGLSRGARVRIDGVPGEYRVLDKMAKRWHNKIDIYMGEDVAAALRWGVREVRIRWSTPGP